MAKSFSIKQRKRPPLPPITQDELRERDVLAQEAFEAWKLSNEQTTVLKQKWDKARQAFHSAMRRMNDQKKKS